MRAAILLLLVAGLLVIGVTANPTRSPSERIIGGDVTTINQYPFATPLLRSSNLVSYFQECAGSILNSRAILSAANCFARNAANRWRIRVGSTWAHSGGTVHNTARIIIHPQYNSGTNDNDIAILHSSTTFTYINNDAQPATTAGSSYNLANNQTVWAIGWGVASVGGQTYEQLRRVQIWVINQETCRSRYAELGWPVTDNMVCSGWLDVGGRDQCQGDSGGPLLHNNVVVGVCSYRYQCALARFPGVNTRVSRYTAWIQSNV